MKWTRVGVGAMATPASSRRGIAKEPSTGGGPIEASPLQSQRVTLCLSDAFRLEAAMGLEILGPMRWTVRRFASPAGLILLALTGVACSKNAESEPALRPASGAPVLNTTAEAIAEISTARCDRDVYCGRIGPNQTYATRERCLAALNSSAYENLNTDACPGGIERGDLVTCLSEISAEPCEKPLDTIEHLTACESSTLCKG